MRPFHTILFATALLTHSTQTGRAQESIADVLSNPEVDLSRPADRAWAVNQIGTLEDNRRANARARATQLGLPLRTTHPNGRILEIADFNPQGQPVYFTTHNANAAISTGANLLRPAPYNLSGSGITVGIWDGGSVRSTHQEFGTRVTIMDGAANVDHSTHVGGTIGATGVTASARGMANLANINSYDWNNDTAEMTGRAATGPGAPANGIYLSNHSYGYISGWNYTGGTGSPARTWEWNGNGTTAVGYEYDFGMYNTYARDIDSLVFAAPYYLPFQSAGNDRGDAPATGDTVALSPGSGTVVAYDPAQHPAADNGYRGGFDTISYRALAKNVITVGSTSDAVAAGVRSTAVANVSYFSSWGPTDDGRIKPDIVANGEALYSTYAGTNTAYGTMSGTSMATPNACGSAALLVQHYGNLFPGGAMRASTLKALLIHTADDRGNAGPDYKYGWGLVNSKSAADLLTDHQAYPDKKRVTESQLTTTTTTRTVSFVWDGTSPIVATLCWTDPAGTATTTTESRTPRLVNNLNLKIIAPGGAEYLPFTMPFVGTWTQASMDLPATTGINNTDNVEQVRLAAPPAAGTYQAIVSFSGTLTNPQQDYSLILSGSSAAAPPPPPPSISAVSPNSGLSQGSTTLTLTGSGFRADTAVKLTKTGESDITATGVTLVNDTTLTCTVDLTNKASGLWNVVATNTGGANPGTATLTSAFTIVGAIWAENFDGTPSGWTSSGGANSWTLTTTNFHSPSRSYFCPGVSTQANTILTSPEILIPSGATNIQLKFWHQYGFQNRKDGGFMEFSVDNGAWFDQSAVNSGFSFSSNGPAATINNFNGNGKRTVWTSSSAGFVETIVNLTNTAKFAGKKFRARWIMSTDSDNGPNTALSAGWWVDSISLVAGGDLTNTPPSIASGPTSSSTEIDTSTGESYQIIRASTADLSVTATDDSGEPGLTYAWSVLSGPSGAAFSNNHSNSAKATTIEFTTSGDYTVGVTVTDPQGLAASGTVNLRVVQTASGMVVSPLAATVTFGGTRQFAGSVIDQFGNALSTQPTLVWSVSGGGTINSSGLFTATAAGSGYVVTATGSGFSNTATVTVNPAAATVTLSNLGQTYNGSPRSATVTTSPAGLTTSVTYDGSTTPPTNAGSYAVVATVTNPNYQGSASGTLVIGKAAATVTLSNLEQTYNGSPRSATVTTSPAGLTTSVTYDGSPTPPTNAGSYAVVATVTNPNYQGSASGTLVINPGNDYTSWTVVHFTPAEKAAGLDDMNADPEHDGLTNLAEYGLGTDPKQFTPLPVPVLADGFLSLTFTRPTGLPGITYGAEQCDQLNNWLPATLEVMGTSGGTDTMRVRIPLGTGEPSKHFLRLRFSSP